MDAFSVLAEQSQAAHVGSVPLVTVQAQDTQRPVPQTTVLSALPPPEAILSIQKKAFAGGNAHHVSGTCWMVQCQYSRI